MTDGLELAPQIAVVIPCFNGAGLLRRTLESLAAQTYLPQEVVVVDNGSDDHPEFIVRDFEQELPIRCVRYTERRGAPAARNEGMRQTKAPYLLFLDADIVLDPDALMKMMNALQMHPDAAFAYSDFYWGWKRFYGRRWDVRALRRRNWIHTSSLIRRADVVPFDESLTKFQDWDLWLTLAEQGKKGVWIDRPLFRVTEQKGGMSHWLPSFVHRLPWPFFGWMPREIKKYRDAEAVIRAKHHL